jgi:hypothetical protein
MLATIAYVVAATSLGCWLDVVTRRGAANCINQRPSTCVSAWSWPGLIVVALWALLA